MVATGSAGSEIIFQKSGVGANPLITAYTGGTGTPGTVLQDGLFKLVGSDYVTIDGIDLQENPANTTNPSTMEYGYGLYKAASTNGAQNNTIKNCTITLNRINNASGNATAAPDGSRGIDVLNVLDTVSNAAVTVTSADGTNSNNKFYSNTIQNVNIGIAVIGFAATSPFTLADTGNDVGGASALTGNTIKNYGGAAAAANPAAGIRTLAQYGLNVSYNTVNSNDGTGVSHPSTLRGIYLNTAVSASETITNNSVTIKGGGTTSAIIAIDNVAGATAASNTVSINSNTITGSTYTTATSGAFTGIQNSASAANVNINSNIFSNNSTNATSGTSTMITSTGAVGTAHSISSNTVGGWTWNAASSGAFTGISASSTAAAATLAINSNNFLGITHAVVGSSVHTYINWTHGASSTGDSVSSNTFTNLNVNTTGSVTFINHGTGSSMTATGAAAVNSNSIVTGFNKGGAGGTVTFFTSAGGDSSVSGSATTYNLNNFSNVTLTGATAVLCLSDSNGASSTSGPTKTITNNTFNNITTGAAQITGITYNFSGNNTTVSNNTLTNLTGAGVILAISAGTSNGGAIETISGNTISDLITTGQVNALQTGFGAVTTGNITGNTITNISTNGAAANPVFPLICSGFGVTTNISKNKIANIQSTGNALAGSVVFGLLTQTAGTTYNIFNNLVGDLRLPANPAANNLQGISIGTLTAGTTVNLSYNTVWLNETVNAQAGFGSSAVSVSTTPALVMVDNIFANTSVFNTTGLTVAYRRSSTTLTTYGAASNNNDFYSGAPGANNLIFNDGTNSDQTMAAYKVRVAGRDSASFSENPTFLSTTGSNAQFLHINPAVATQIESGGIPVAGIGDDFDGDARNVATPDIGADEFNGIGIDLSGPAISYTPLGNTAGAGNRVVAATIGDATGVDQTAGNAPRIWFRKGAVDPFSQTTCLSTGGTPQNGTYDCTINYSLVTGGSVMAGDTIQYYVAAEDTLGNVSTNPAGGSGVTPPGMTPPGSPNSYSILASISGTKTVGTGGDYPTLTAALADLNAKVLTGTLVLTLTDPSYDGSETFPLVINENGGSSPTNTVTIKPSAGISPTISGTVSSGCLIRLNGADYITIDGSNNGSTSRDMTITNSATTSPASVCISSLGVGAGATNNTVKNTNISTGINSSIGFGVSVGSGSAGGTSGADNDNTTIQNNSITVAAKGIFAVGTAAASAGGLDSLTISGNSIDTTTTLAPIGVQVGNALNSTLSLNSVSVESSVAAAPVGISIETGFVSSTINRNTINKVLTTNTGGEGGRAITVGTGTASSALTIRNNFITGVNGSNWTGFNNSSSMGIALGMVGASTTITTTAGGINVYYNSVNMAGDYSSTFNGQTAALYVGSGASALDVRNNIFANSLNNTGTGTTSKQYAIFSAAANTAFTSINYNDYFVSGTQGVLGFLTSDRTDLAGIVSGFGGNANSISGDPLFTSATNLHILTSGAASPVARKGVTIAGITVDIDGDTRKATPDVGADEFTTYLLTYTAGANGSLLGLSSQIVNPGANGTSIMANADSGYHFVNWSDLSTDNPRTDMNVMADISVTANFAPDASPTATATETATPTATATSTPTATATATSTPTATATATPSYGYSYCDCYIHAYANSNGDCNSYGHVYSDANSDRDRNCDSDCNSHLHTYADSYCNCNRNFDVYAYANRHCNGNSYVDANGYSDGGTDLSDRNNADHDV